MSDRLLSTRETALRLGLSVATLYDWLAQSDAGEFVLRGEPVTISYFQGGAKGQGRIKIDAKEIERILSLMKVSPKPKRQRQSPKPRSVLQHITAQLGKPDE